MLGQLYGKGVITLRQKLIMEAESLESNRMEYFLDRVILPSLDTDVSIKYKGFLEVMEKSDDAILNSMAKKLGMHIRTYLCVYVIRTYIRIYKDSCK